MLYFIFRIFVNALALLIMIWLTPGVDLVRTLPMDVVIEIRSQNDEIQAASGINADQLIAGLTFAGQVALLLLAGAMFALAHWLFTPAVLLVAGGAVLWSFGLLMVAVNALILWMSAINITGEGGTIILPGGPNLALLLLAAAIFTVVLFVLEGITGLDSPLKDRPNSRRRYWRALNRLTIGGRNFLAENLRIAQGLDTMTRYLRDMLFDASPFGGVRRFFQRLIYRRRKPLINESMAETTRYMLQDLGATFVKVGQIVSSRADQLPPQWRSELARLQSQVAPFPVRIAQHIVEEELGKPLEELYAAFDVEPLAAASTAQVHKARLKTGEKVVVKVQRPDIDVTVRADLNIMRDLTRLAEQRFDWARKADINAIMTEYAENILLELDYTHEAFNGRMLAENMRMFPNVHVPLIYPELSSGKVMTQEFVRGVKITNIEAIDAAGLDRNALAQTFVRCVVKQVIYDGFFHGDPHPGNVLVDTETGTIIFLDLGMMGTLTTDKRLALADLMWSLSERDGREVARTVLRLTLSSGPVDEEKFLQDAERLLKRYTAFPDLPLSVSGAMQTVLDALGRAGLRMDPDLTLALKAMIQAEETAHRLDPNLQLAQAALEATRDLFVETFDPDKLVHALRTQVLRTAKQAARSIPTLEQALAGWLQQFQRGKFVLHLDGTDLTKQIGELDNAITRNIRHLALALLVVGLLVGGSIASNSPPRPYPWLPTIAYFIFVGAAVTAAGVIVRSLWRWLRGKEV